MDIREILAGQATVALYRADVLALALASRAVSFDTIGASYDEREQRYMLFQAYAATFEALAFAMATAEHVRPQHEQTLGAVMKGWVPTADMIDRP